MDVNCLVALRYRGFLFYSSDSASSYCYSLSFYLFLPLAVNTLRRFVNIFYVKVTTSRKINFGNLF